MKFPTPDKRAFRFVLAMVPCAAMVGVGGEGTLERLHLSCASGPAAAQRSAQVDDEPAHATVATVAAAQKAEPAPAAAAAPVESAPPPDPRSQLVAWLTARLPDGGALVTDDGPVGLVHTVRAGDTVASIAAAYVDLTTADSEGALARSLQRANPGFGKLVAGRAVRIPDVVDAPVAEPKDARLAWPEDRALRGIYLNSTMMGAADFPTVLDKVAARNMNAIVVDAKDVTGWFTYPTKIPLALEANANKHVTIGSYSRLVRAAHRRGLRVVSRIACFRDEHLAPTHGALAIQNKWGGPHKASTGRVDWLDPSNDQVQQYLLDVVQESLDAGVDEIQLDYVRYPTEGVGDADFHLKEKKLATEDVITGFVEKVHAVTKAAGVPLSLDVFGCVAWQYKADMASTGQDLRRLGAHVEALSPMVYPSHFDVGFQGFEVPGDHPEIVAIGTKKARETLDGAGFKDVVVRSWVQAFPWKSPHFGTGYIAEQIKQAGLGGGVGFLAWNSGGEYGATYAAVAVTKKGPTASK